MVKAIIIGLSVALITAIVALVVIQGLQKKFPNVGEGPTNVPSVQGPTEAPPR